MRKSAVQISFSDIYNGVSESIEQKKSGLVLLLEEHIDFDGLIPAKFKRAFYTRMGRSHCYHLEGFIRALILQKLLGIPTDSLLITILKNCRELCDFCGFDKVPDASQFTRFRAKYCEFIAEMFEHLVDLTEPICRQIDSKKSDYLIYDTTGIELPVAENNPKYLNAILKETKKFAKKSPGFNPYSFAYSLMPDASKTNLDARKSHRTVSAKADVYLAGIVQLVGVLLADALHKRELYKSIRKLIA